MQHNRILDALKSPNATLGVLGLALIAQMPHAADVFRLIVHGSDLPATLHSYTFAIALELAVLLFVVQNRSAESYGFAGVSIAMNLSYYHLHNVHLFNVAALPALLVSVALPVAIARYSHAVAVAPVHTEPVQDEQTASLTVIMQPENKPDAQRNDIILHDDRLMDMQSRIADLQSEGFDAKWIATHEFADIAGTQLADLLNVNASTISRWRNKAKSNGHNIAKEEA